MAGSTAGWPLAWWHGRLAAWLGRKAEPHCHPEGDARERTLLSPHVQEIFITCFVLVGKLEAGLGPVAHSPITSLLRIIRQPLSWGSALWNGANHEHRRKAGHHRKCCYNPGRSSVGSPLYCERTSRSRWVAGARLSRCHGTVRTFTQFARAHAPAGALQKWLTSES